MWWMTKRVALATFAVLLSITAKSVLAACAIAVVPGYSDQLGIAYGYESVKGAEQRAIEECRSRAKELQIKGKCKVVVSGPGPGYLAVSSGGDGTGYGIGSTAQDAVDTAYNACAKKFKNCNGDNIKYWTGKVAAGNGRKVVSTTRSQNDVTCQNVCSNGNCVRTLPDGRKERWQAPRVYNSFTRNWEWDTSTNACGA